MNRQGWRRGGDGWRKVDGKVREFKLHVKQTAGPFEKLEPEVCVS